MPPGRRKSREAALKVLFAQEFGSSVSRADLTTLFEHFDIDPSALTYAQAIVTAVAEQRSQLDSVIESHSFHWKLSRIPKVELAILRLVLAEVLVLRTIPPKVGISEAIELGLDYSGEGCRGYLNGVLDAAFEGLLEEGG